MCACCPSMSVFPCMSVCCLSVDVILRLSVRRCLSSPVCPLVSVLCCMSVGVSLPFQSLSIRRGSFSPDTCLPPRQFACLLSIRWCLFSSVCPSVFVLPSQTVEICRSLYVCVPGYPFDYRALLTFVCYRMMYSTPRANTYKLEEPVNRELNVTRS